MRIADNDWIAERLQLRPGAGDYFGADAGHVAEGEQKARKWRGRSLLEGHCLA